MLAVFVLLRYKYLRKLSNYPQNRNFPEKKRKKIKGAFAASIKSKTEDVLFTLRFSVDFIQFDCPVNDALDDRQVFFRAELQLVACPLALFAVLPD